MMKIQKKMRSNASDEDNVDDMVVNNDDPTDN